VPPTVRPAVRLIQVVIAVAVNWDTRTEKEILTKPDARLKSVAFEIDIFKPAPTVTTTPIVKSSTDCMKKMDINTGNTGNRLNLSEKTNTRSFCASPMYGKVLTVNSAKSC
jgi:hypothetical protein